MMPAPSLAPRTLRIWLLGGLLVLLLAMRIFPAWFMLVDAGGAPRFPDNDPYFHLRQALYCNAHFPEIQRWEDVSRYPERERNDAAGLYDLFLGGAARLAAGGAVSARAVQWVCFLFPPLCMGGVLLLGYRLLRQNCGGALAVLLAGWLVLVPGDGVARSTLGFCDHHVVEMLLGVACILAWVKLLRTEETAPLPWWRPAWLAALPVSLFHFTWLGGPIHLLVLATTTCVLVLAETAQGETNRVAARALTRLLAAHIILTAVPGLLWPDLPLNLRFHHGMLAGAVVLMAALPSASWLLARAARRFSPLRAFWLGLGVIVVFGGLAYAASGQVRTFAAMLLTPKSLLVAEDRPVDAGYYFFITGMPGLLLLAAPVVMLLTGAWRKPLWLAASVPSWLLVALWPPTRDYAYQGALHAVLASGPVLAALTDYFGTTRKRRTLLTAGLAAVTLAQAVLVWPLARTAAPWLKSGQLSELLFAHEGWREAAAWLNRQPVPPPAATTSGVTPPRGRIGVLGDWSTGALLNTLTSWPAVNSRYPDAEGIRPLLLTDEDAVRAAPLRGSNVAVAVAYVLVEPPLVGDSLGRHLETAGFDPHEFFGRSIVRVAGEPRRMTVLNRRSQRILAIRLMEDDGQALRHFRLVFESRQESVLRDVSDPEGQVMMRTATLIRDAAERTRWAARIKQGSWDEDGDVAYAGLICPSVKIYQQVEGATVTGSAPTGTAIIATLDLRVENTGRTFRYRQAIRAGAGDTFSLTLPYGNERPAAGDVVPAAAWTLQIGDRTLPLTVRESDVLAGAALSVPAP